MPGCQKSTTQVSDIQVRDYQFAAPPEAERPAAPPLKQMDDPRVSLSGAVATTQPSFSEVLIKHLPDPTQAEAVFRARLETFSDTIRRDYEAIFFGEENSSTSQPGAMTYVREIERPKQYRLTLNEAIRRALANNYQIRVEGYGPAISTAQIVQAEAAFDAAFFTNLNRTNLDQPRPTAFQFNESQTTLWQTGIRQLLATGATASLTYQLQRSYVRLQASARPQAINPAYSETFAAELRQPFLRNFGIDFNRAQINISKNDRRGSEERFRRNVIDVLNRTEFAYWELARTRRDVVLTAELVAQAERTLAQVSARIDYDAYETLKYNSEASVAARKAEFIQVKNAVWNAEDALLNLLNDPDLKLSDDWEVIPVDVPTAAAVVRDRFHEVETALLHRPEIQEAKYLVENARIQLGIAKNQALPRLDVVYRWTANGLGRNGDRAFDQMAGGDFTDNFIGLEFLWNFGERAERAGIRAAAMSHSQAIAAFRRAVDDVITDCRTTLRQLQTSFEQIGPNSEAVTSSEDNLRSIQEREERKSPEQLNTVLNAQVQLAANRRALLQAIITYNQTIIDVERAKGTLLEYDNVVLSEVP
ncbi:MAG: TolC family protein [Phycisphaerae bacterium]|nr:TolC family protein [Phycisphaerae bacterium]